MHEITLAVETVLATAPAKYNGYKDRLRKGKLGLKAMLKILEDFGYTVTITISPPPDEQRS